MLLANKHYLDETIQSLILELYEEGELLEVQQFRYKLLPAERFIEGHTGNFKGRRLCNERWL